MYNSKKILLASLLATSLYGTDNQILLENSWSNISYSTAKDSMLSGATTATGKGYSALFTNPAGLATNYSTGLYTRAVDIDHKNANGSTDDDNSLTTTKQITTSDTMAIGVFYKSFVVESQKDIHNALGMAYGYESKYGLFSVGANYVIDTTTVDNYLDAGTGDYYTIGFQWQKSFIDIDDFYGLYFGFSKKGQGVNIIDGEQIGVVSPIVQKIGFGFETNVFSSTMLVTLDMTDQSWSHIGDTLSTQAIGLKWMMFSGFSIGLGASTSSYSTELNLKDSTTLSAGVEFVIWKMNVAVAAVQKDVNNKSGDVYMQENSLHADISFAF